MSHDAHNTPQDPSTTQHNLWSNPAPQGSVSFPEIDSDELKRLALAISRDPAFQERLLERLAPYRTPVTWRTLMQRLD